MGPLNRLTDQYENIITTLDTLGDDSSVCTLGIIICLLLQKSQGRNMRLNNDEIGCALFKGTSKMSKGAARCNFCKGR